MSIQLARERKFRFSDLNWKPPFSHGNLSRDFKKRINLISNSWHSRKKTFVFFQRLFFSLVLQFPSKTQGFLFFSVVFLSFRKFTSEEDNFLLKHFSPKTSLNVRLFPPGIYSPRDKIALFLVAVVPGGTSVDLTYTNRAEKSISRRK